MYIYTCSRSRSTNSLKIYDEIDKLSEDFFIKIQYYYTLL